MKRLIIISMLVFALGGGYVRCEDVYSLILTGRLEQARDSLSRVATASSRDGNLLYYQSLLEPEADQAAHLMEAALQASVLVRYEEEIYYRLAQYYVLKKNYQRLSRLLADYHSRWEKGKYRDEMQRLSVLLEELGANFEAALQQCDRYLVSHTEGDDEQWGNIDKARILNAHKKGIGASKMLRRLSHAESGPGIPQALYLLGTEAAKQKRVDDAVFFYSLLREGYPSAVGLDDLVEKLGGISAGAAPDNAAEKLTGTFYSVKVGVFSDAANARRQADKFRNYDQKVEIKPKNISGKKYHVVYVGRFEDYSHAARFRIQLEAAHSEVFQVVAR